MTTFSYQVIKEILQKAHEYHSENWDYLRFGPNPVANTPGRILWDPDHSTQGFIDIINNLSQFEWLHGALEDDYSRGLLLNLLAYRVLGYGHVKLPLNTEQFWQEYRTIDSRFLRKANVAKSSMGDLNLYALPQNQELRLITHPLYILMLLIGQYYYQRNGIRIQPEHGDVVIDGGGCWGDAAIEFASSVGASGKVFSFEFVPENLLIFRENLASCVPCSEVITIVENALGSESNLRIPYHTMGPASHLSGQETGRTVESRSIDHFVAGNHLERVDFIKMDIEGSELAALQGAQDTLKRFKPNLAISLYHRPHDLFQIPGLIRQIEAGYRFYLDHYTIHLEETVLYAQAR